MRLPWLFLGLLLFPALVRADGPPQVKEKDAGKAYAIPFRLTDSGHILVRARINGKGPYNFIVDTGAPMVYIAVPVAKKIGIETDKKGLQAVDKFQLEGGPVHENFKCVIETPFQLEGMNAMGMAGVELHGIIGYTFLAHYKMEIDATKDHMTWTKLDFKPPQPEPIGKENAPTGLDAMGTLMKAMAALMGVKGAPEPKLRGYLGITLKDAESALVVDAVFKDSPAAAAGLKPGDRVLTVDGKRVAIAADVAAALASVSPGQRVTLAISRDNSRQEITITAGEGL
jgi:membrane-associated protease RseP (regulator of RpoE activity)